jgi:hypothetical protein
MEGEGVIESTRNATTSRRERNLPGPSETASIATRAAQLKLFHLIVPRKADR